VCRSGRNRQAGSPVCRRHRLVQRSGTGESAGRQAPRSAVKLRNVGVLPDYSRQAERYDETRSASPSVLRGLREALKGAPGRRLADIGGGTGNYALALRRKGWEPVVVDRSAAMLAWAAAKGLKTVEADAQRLPFEDETFDAATMISMLHHVEDRGVALAEARRILRPRGLLVLVGYTGEDAATLWILDYFPSSRHWIEATHPPRAAILEELPGARLFAFEFEDMQDASLAALSADPSRVLEAAERGETSYFERMSRDHPEELRAGLARLREDIAAGQAPKRAGTATVCSWTKR
jgi:SAM-dependent methyltransferase